MKVLRVAIVDDEPMARRDLELLVRAESGVDLVGRFGSAEEAVRELPALRPDVLLLDVKMPGMDGFALLDALPAQTVRNVIFVSAFDRFALQAFEVSAVDYLLKPADPERLRMALARVAQRLAEQREDRMMKELFELRELFAAERGGNVIAPRRGLARRLLIRETSRTRVVAVETVHWMTADRNYTILHTTDGRFSLREALSNLVERLDPLRFVRIHRSTIVAVDQVRQLEPGFHGELRLTTRSGAVLRVSRRYREELERALDDGSSGGD